MLHVDVKFQVVSIVIEQLCSPILAKNVSLPLVVLLLTFYLAWTWRESEGFVVTRQISHLSDKQCPETITALSQNTIRLTLPHLLLPGAAQSSTAASSQETKHDHTSRVRLRSGYFI